MTPENRLHYNKTFESLYTLAMGGQRVYFPEPSFYFNEELNTRHVMSCVQNEAKNSS